jgi:hypothetical protein
MQKRYQGKGCGFKPKVAAKYPVTNPSSATETYPANSFSPIASPLHFLSIK